MFINGLQRFWLHHHDCFHARHDYCRVLKLTLSVELRALLSSGQQPLLKCPLCFLLAIQLLGNPHEDSGYTAMIAIMQSHIFVKTHPGGKVVSSVITFCLPSGCYCSLNLNSMVITWHVQTIKNLRHRRPGNEARFCLQVDHHCLSTLLRRSLAVQLSRETTLPRLHSSLTLTLVV